MKHMIDLRSDTLTRLSKKDIDKLEFSRIGDARIGDDCYNEDYYVQDLEAYCCKLFGKEATLFMPSGTMSNIK